MRNKFWYSVLGTAAAAAAYVKLVRPRLLNWGATEEEVHRRMPGDEIVDNPTYVTTRAITIEANPDDIWPWIVQMGEHRGGFYSYDFIDRLLGMNVHSAHRVLPRYQKLEVGDALDREGNMVVRHIEPRHALVIGSGKDVEGVESTWTIALYPIEKQRTRLVSRARPRFNLKSPKALALLTVLDPGQFIMERKFLREIKAHAEGRSEIWPPETAPTLH